MNKVNNLVLCRDEYKNQEEFENELKKTIMLLLDAGYIMTVKYDEKGMGIIAIDYDYANQEYGCPYPHWLTPEEDNLRWKQCEDEQNDNE